MEEAFMKASFYVGCAAGLAASCVACGVSMGARRPPQRVAASTPFDAARPVRGLVCNEENRLSVGGRPLHKRCRSTSTPSVSCKRYTWTNGSKEGNAPLGDVQNSQFVLSDCSMR